MDVPRIAMCSCSSPEELFLYHEMQVLMDSVQYLRSSSVREGLLSHYVNGHHVHMDIYYEEADLAVVGE